MNLTVKILKSKEFDIQVDPDTTILQMKQQIEKMMHIPAAHQKIVHVGRALIDSNAISAYPAIKDGSKLSLIVKKPAPLRDVIYRSFRKYFNEAQSNKLAQEFMKDFESKMQQFSLDDLEKLAENMVKDDETQN